MTDSNSGPNRRLAFALLAVLVLGIVALVTIVIVLFGGGDSDTPSSHPSAVPSNGTPTQTITRTAWPTNPIPAKK